MTEAKKPLIPPVLRVFLLAMILANFGGRMFYPLQPLYLKELGADVGQIGLFFTLSMIVPLVMQVFGGWVSDRIGRLRAMAIGSVAGSIGWIGMCFAPTWGWLLVIESFGSIAMAFVAPSFDAFIAEQAEEKSRGRVFATSQAIYQVVGVAGPLAGGFAVKTFGFKTVLFMAASLYLVATVIRIILSRRNPRHPAPVSGQDLRQGFGASLKTIGGMALAGGIVTWLLVSDGARDIAMGLSDSFIPLFLQEQRGFDSAGIGSLNALLGIATMLVMIPAGHFSDRFGERAAIALGYFGAAIAFICFALIPGPIATTVTYLAFGLAIGILMPAYQSLISKAFPEKLRGLAFGFLSTSNGLIALPAPFLGGLLWRGIGPRVPFLVTSFVMLVVIIPVWYKFKLPKTAAGPGSEAVESAASAEAQE